MEVWWTLLVLYQSKLKVVVAANLNIDYLHYQKIELEEHVIFLILVIHGA